MVTPIKIDTSDSDPKVAILLAVYNGMPWIEEQVQSIFDQQGVNISLFISIDPSSDDSEQWCRALAQKTAQVTVIERGISQQSATQNFFNLIKHVDISTFDYIGFSDQDDIWQPNKVHKALDALQAGGFDGYSSNVEAFWESGKRELINKAQKQTRWDHFFEAAGPGCTYLLTNKLMSAIKNRLLLSADLSDTLGFHDWFCYAFAREFNYRWFIDHNSYMHYRQHDSNVVGVNQGFHAFFKRTKHVLSGEAIKQSKNILAVLASDKRYAAQITLPSSHLDYFKLALRYRHCRRRFKDQCLFFMFCAIMSIYKHKH